MPSGSWNQREESEYKKSREVLQQGIDEERELAEDYCFRIPIVTEEPRRVNGALLFAVLPPALAHGPTSRYRIKGAVTMPTAEATVMTCSCTVMRHNFS
jgi:hypothetical protein